MKRYREDFIEKIREISRKEKLSFKKLGERFNIHNSTIRNWCYGLPSNRWETLIIGNEKIRKKLKNSETSVVPKIDSIGKNQAKFLAAILYGREGSKYPSSNAVSFVNSDPYLILAFLKLLKKSFDLDRKKFSLHLQIHTSHNYEKLRKFWANLLDLPETCFIKPTVREPKGKKHRDNYLGTCTLCYRDYRIQLKLLGVFEAFIKISS
ncbi:ADP-dependent glucokinase/phosphofructokinase [Patescibacteria group bacterium]|nr:ADP-dependent glucokinase/phosphofructokinase [Patescibacteria group bacterium]